MAIRFTPEYRKYIKDIVDPYNRRVIAANKEGKIPKKFLPETVSLRKLKKNYPNRKALNKELANLKAFSRESVRQIETIDDVTLTSYDINLINTNKKEVIDYYQSMYDVLAPKIEKGYYAEKERVEQYRSYLNLLRKDERELTGQDLKTLKAATNLYRESFNIRGGGYRGFLVEVEWVMRNVGIPKEDRDRFFKKLEQVDQDQFWKIYNTSDLIERVYDLVDSPEFGPMKLNTKKEDARELIDDLIAEIDALIEETAE